MQGNMIQIHGKRRQEREECEGGIFGRGKIFCSEKVFWSRKVFWIVKISKADI